METVFEENTKNQIENVCNIFLEIFADENDSKLNDDGGFYNNENFYDWDNHTFVINFFSISQDDFLGKFKLFEKLGSELKEKINEIVEVREVFWADDCPIIFFEINN